MSDWTGCYDDCWQGLIVPDAFAHPAKFAYGLITRIVAHGLREGFWKPGDLIGDPFGGVALGGISAGYRGLNWVGVELEPRFVELGNRNLAKHGPEFMASGASMVKLVQGDSRRFAEIVGECVGCVTSPPYAESLQNSGGKRLDTSIPAVASRMSKAYAGGGDYPTTPGQIGTLPTGDLAAVVTSSPYAETYATRNGPSGLNVQLRADGSPMGYGQSERQANAEGYGITSGQIGALSTGTLDAAVTSPPWENQEPSHAQGSRFETVHRQLHPTKPAKDRPGMFQHEYGDSDGQIGTETAETYWTAMRKVYSQVWLAIKPNGVAAIVVKDYVKNRKRVPLCDQTCELLMALGFDVFERVHALLVKEDSHPDLFGGGDHVKRTERKSFFRRLAEKKGSPRIDWEEVIWARKA